MERGSTLGMPNGQRGIAAVEFAIILPVVMLLMLATAELGRVFYQYNTLTKAVENGARYLAAVAITGTTGVIIEDIRNSVEALNAKNLVVYGKMTGGSVPVLENLSIDNIDVMEFPEGVGADHVRVSATYIYRPMFVLLPMFGFGPDDVRGIEFTPSVIMRAL